LRDVRRITRKAEKVIDSAESVSEIFRQATGPLAIIKILRNIVKPLKARKGELIMAKNNTKRFVLGTVLAAITGYVAVFCQHQKAARKPVKILKMSQ